MPSLELRGVSAVPSAKAIATGPTPAIWSLRLVGSRTCRFREIGRASFIPRSQERYRRYEPQVAQGLTEMFVAGTSTHKVGKVAETLMGMTGSRQCHQSAQPRSGAAIHRLARTPTTRALAYPLVFTGFISACVTETRLMPPSF